MLRKVHRNLQSLSAKTAILQEQNRKITTKQLVNGISTKSVEQKKMWDVQAHTSNGVGIVRLNREHRNNMLTPKFVNQVRRGVETFYFDHSVKVIYLTTVQGEQFSNGTDFRTMLHYKAENKVEYLAKYLEDVFQLQATFAKINKPIMTVAPGNSFNSGAGILAASGLPAICDTSKLAFNECTFGFVPHAGSTYYCERLPGDFGTFLLLTGFPITGKDAVELKLADKLIEIPETYEEEVQDIVMAMDPSSMPDAATANGTNELAHANKHFLGNNLHFRA
jgi:enoyl-CoA hydratase/carnithine racemase